MPLNLSGVILVAGVMPILLGLLTSIYWRTRRIYPGFGFWVMADFAIGLGYILLGLRAEISPFLSILVGNAIAVYGVVLIYEGLEAFFGRPLFNLFNHLLVGVYVLFQAYFTYLRPDGSARIILTSAVLAVLHLRMAYALLTHAPAPLRRIGRGIAVMFGAAALACAVRAGYAAMQPSPLELLSDPWFIAVAFASIAAITIWNFYVLFLNSARIEVELEGAGERLADSDVASRRELAQLALLEETSRLIAGSLDEPEILQRTVHALVERFHYAEAAVCILVGGDQLEITAISGTENTGFNLGYRQRIGEGIVGHVAQTGEAYVTEDIEHDGYYYGVGSRSGSAAGVPLFNHGELYGVLYIESATRSAFTHTDAQMLAALAGHVATAVNKARLYASTQDHLVVMTALHRTAQIITSSLELDRIFQTVLQLLKDTFGYTRISIYLLEGDVLRLGGELGYPEKSVLMQIPVTEGVMGRAVLTRQLQFIRDVSQDPAFVRAAHDVTNEICVPLFKNANVLGVINVEAGRRNPLNERDVDVLTALAGPIAIAIDNAHLHAEAKALARTDGLTGLMNRRTLDQTLEAEIARAARYDYPLTLMIMDIDDFKASNDQWGHPAGDAILRAMAHMIATSIRITDSAARYGGDEFAIILPNTPLADGLELGERLRLAAAKLGRDSNGIGVPPGEYTISLGVASYPDNATNAEQLLQAADHAELEAKKLGKNRICAATQPQSP
jgi:diguanylate cyclase (GGDEF)-like protein